MIVVAIGHSGDRCVVGQMKIGVGVTGWPGAFIVSRTTRSIGTLIAGHARGGGTAKSEAGGVGAIVSQFTEIGDTAIGVVGMWSDGSTLNSAAGEARSSNVGIWRGAGLDIVVTHTETAAGVVAKCYATIVEAIINVVSTEHEARIVHGLAGMVIGSPRVDSVGAMAVDCIGRSEDVSTVSRVVTIVHGVWVFVVSISFRPPA